MLLWGLPFKFCCCRVSPHWFVAVGSPHASLLLSGLPFKGLPTSVCYCGVSPCFSVITGSPSNSVSLWGLPIMVIVGPPHASRCQHTSRFTCCSRGVAQVPQGGSWLPPTVGMARGQPGISVPPCVSQACGDCRDRAGGTGRDRTERGECWEAGDGVLGQGDGVPG